MHNRLKAQYDHNQAKGRNRVQEEDLIRGCKYVFRSHVKFNLGLVQPKNRCTNCKYKGILVSLLVIILVLFLLLQCKVDVVSCDI